MRRLLAITLLLSAVIFVCAPRAGVDYGSLPRPGFTSMETPVEFCPPPGCAYASLGGSDYAHSGQGRCVARVKVTALVTGDIDSRIETSSNGSNWYTLHAFSNCAAAPCTGVYYGTTQALQYARLVVVANGTPSLATADLTLDCTP